jgi:hypothetical protein
MVSDHPPVANDVDSVQIGDHPMRRPITRGAEQDVSAADLRAVPPSSLRACW